MDKKSLTKLVAESEKLLNENDSLQASEKLYKVSEECIKILAIKYGMAEKNKRKWTTLELNEFAYRLKDILGNDLYTNWKVALEDLHKDGFHENDLSTVEVFDRIHCITDLLELI